MSDIDKLIEARDRARADLATIGDMQPGSLQETLSRCGKPHCRCAKDDAVRHSGTILVRYVDGKTRSTRVRRDEVEETQALIDEYRRFQDKVKAFVASSGALAEARRKEKRTTGRQKRGVLRQSSRRASPPISSA